ncbi:MAG: alkaline phosphatase family protein [Methyloligellaceae bacterium]
MEKTLKTRILIVVFDALRPDFVTPDLMPHLHAFQKTGVRYLNSRSTFPTETRVNQSAVITGCYPSRHGIVANRFPEPDGAPGEVLDSGNDVALEATFDRLDGRLFDVPTLGELLKAAGRSYATLSAGTAGGGRLINHAIARGGGFRLAMRRPEATVPENHMAKIISRVGPLPPFTRPATDWISWAVECYLAYVEPEITPDVMLLWLCEPDASFHQLGIGAAGTLEALRRSDSEFGRILAEHAAEIETGQLQIITLSDHGQISLAGDRLDIVAHFNEAGFAAAAKPEDETDYIIVMGNAGGVWVRDSDPRLITDMVEWAREQDWCGPIFTRDGAAGTLTQNLIGTLHRRAPDVALIMRYDAKLNDWGYPGTSVHASNYTAGGGCHGGLSPYELQTFLAMAGGNIKANQSIAVPAGISISPPRFCTCLDWTFQSTWTDGYCMKPWQAVERCRRGAPLKNTFPRPTQTAP